MQDKIKEIIKVIIRNPKRLAVCIIDNKYFKWISDEKFIRFVYYCRTGKKLNLEKPNTYNEKLQWLKLNDHNPKYIKLVDKYEVREYIRKEIGEEYLIPLLGVYEKFEDIDFKKLPDEFVIKSTHDSGGVVLCNSKSEFNISKAKKKINRSLNRNYYYKGREWPYKNVKPRIVCEALMIDESEKELKDYKIFCFNGEPKAIQVDYDRFTNHKRNIYDIDWNYIPMTLHYPTDPTVHIKRPSKLGEMLDIAKKLSSGFPHVRVDLYSIADKIYFGELTFIHGSGFEKFDPAEFDERFGKWMSLPL
ncbi:TupA-like ATPgrasp [Peptoclostridium litorale DSM 5388]|uniref:Uncharacterized protein n=1 Tax=Peptoclostridium litorale DSM 5388 TaxID=1121324 RepID=A0A069RD30_PEPLI|nr:ATP-grasp fold amidoligase family protein [Peptoclostridium litorale]KDR94658.1 hypothetical protein CLIT_14c01190 [Peptoclostridium litorale DSM 5388]SIO30154.1 TupA-like ATPgrasp [Peptoclostridium litorale DSM 5388]